MTQSEELALLSGSEADKKTLFLYLLNSLQENGSLPDSELAMFEYLKTVFTE